MRRREFIAGLAGRQAVAWPLTARAQQVERVRQVGMLIAGAANDARTLARIAAFREALAKLGWEEGRNLRMELRFGPGDTDRMRANAAELINLTPELIVVSSAAATRALRQLSQSVPIVFTLVSDPVASGLVGSLARPESNATGFSHLEASIAGKMVQLLKEAAPGVMRIGHIFDPANSPQVFFASIEAFARRLGIQAVRVPVRTAIDISGAIDAFTMEPNGGLLVTPDNTTSLHRETIIRLATEYRLPTIFPASYFTKEGGLMAYGVDDIDQFRRAASYVDRILRGAKVSELPVQFPTKFEFTINLKTAKALGLTVPPTMLAIADVVIE